MILQIIISEVKHSPRKKKLNVYVSMAPVNRVQLIVQCVKKAGMDNSVKFLTAKTMVTRLLMKMKIKSLKLKQQRQLTLHTLNHMITITMRIMKPLSLKRNPHTKTKNLHLTHPIQALKIKLTFGKIICQISQSSLELKLAVIKPPCTQE